MDASCCEFKKLMSQVLSDLKYMSNQVIKKTDILLNEVESLNVNSVDALSQSIITLFERINLNITDFSTTFNNALVKYKKAEEIKKSESTEADPNLAFPTEKEEKIQVDEDELPEMAAPVPAEKTDIEVVKIKEERDDSDLDEPTLLNFDVPVDSKELQEECEADQGALIPCKSKDSYVKEYDKFCKWRCAKNINKCDEKVVMAYLSQMSKVYKPASLWCTHSKLKKMLKINEDVDISKFSTVTEFMKKNSKGDEVKKSYVLQRSDIQEFMLKAPDYTYLLIKVVTVFGIFGACRRKELRDLCIQDVTTEGSVLLVKIRNVQPYTPRQFTIVPDDGPVDYIALYNKYISLRPKHARCNSLFLSYHSGKCSSQPVGKNTFGKMPRMIAEFLQLPNADKYTGHCFRRSAATLLGEKSNFEVVRIRERRNNITESYGETSLQNQMMTQNFTSEGSSIWIPETCEEVDVDLDVLSHGYIKSE